MDWSDLLFPKTCPCCGGELPDGQTVCDGCAPKIRVNPLSLLRRVSAELPLREERAGV